MKRGMTRNGAGQVAALPQEERFRLSVDRNGPRMRPKLTRCHVWTGSRDKHGYGWFNGFGERKAHRAAWARAHGPIPAGAQVLHECDNPSCVRVEHLHLGTNAQNHAEKVARQRAKGINMGDNNGMRKHPGLSRGERNAQATLTEADVLAIRARAAVEGRGTNAALAREYGITAGSISVIVSGKSWAHVGGPIKRTTFEE